MTVRNKNLQELIPADQLTATETGTGVDLQGDRNPGGREMAAFLSIGVVSGTTPTCDVKLQESDALGSGYTDISGATFTQATAATRETIYFQTLKRYVRAIATIAGTNPSFDTAVVLVSDKILT
jgi:hypothetical protein